MTSTPGKALKEENVVADGITYSGEAFLTLEDERRSCLLGVSAGLTLEDINEKVHKISGVTIYAGAVTYAGAVAYPCTATEIYFPPSLLLENASLRQEIEQLKDKLSELEERIPAEKVIVLREITREEARQEIRNLFSSGRTLYYSDVAEELRLDLELVVDICNELQEAGEISIDARVS